jgi:predicted transcriptional regulator YdeE
MAEIINLAEAVSLTHAFQNSTIGTGQTISAIFEKEIIEQILNQVDCCGINIYNALNEEGKITFVLVGYDKDKKDMVEGIIVDKALICPKDYYDTNSPLKHV